MPHVELVAIASREKAKAEEWAARHGLEAETYESLIARSDIHVIYSPLPVGRQEEWVQKAAAKGKHIICEKSITYSLESAERMVDVCKQNGVALYENFMTEFHPQHAKVLAMIAEGAIGTPRIWQGAFGFPPYPKGNIRFNEELKGGSLNDCGCYTVFMARKIMQSEPTAVTCKLFKDSGEVDMRGSVLLEFPAATALLSFGLDLVYQNNYSVWGPKGLVRVNRAFAIPPTLQPKMEYVTNDGTQEYVEPITALAADQFALSFDYFCGAVASNDKNKIDDMYERIIQQATVMEAMRTSAREGRRVSL